MQPVDTTAAAAGNPYYPQYDNHHQPPYQNPNPNYSAPNSTNLSLIDPYVSPYPATSASAPRLSSSYAPPDYLNYPSSFSHFPDHSSSSPTAPSFPNPNLQFDFYQAPSYAPLPHYLDAPVNFDRWGGYDHQNQNSVYDSQVYGAGAVPGSEDEGVYRYEGGKVEQYGARGTSGYMSSCSASQVMFDDYGRPISLGNGNGYGGGKAAAKVVKAAPKEDADEYFKGGVQKFRVKVLAEGYGQTDMDVLCQVGLDGIRMLDPATSRTLRIYPFDSVTKWEVLDSYIFAFWAKLPVDVESKRIRLKSSSYTTNTILDTVTAASVQLKEIAERKVPDSSKSVEQLAEKKKGFDWMNLMKPPNEEKDHWVPDEAVNKCSSCDINFNAFVRKHHCRNCGEIFCDKCTQGRTPLTLDEGAPPVRVCDCCMAEVTQRLENAREAANRGGAFLSHEDLAKKLKEEMSRNSKASSAGSKYEGSQTQKREVACPTCTVHLQVEVPSSGSETIECSVCQHPFLVSAH